MDRGREAERSDKRGSRDGSANSSRLDLASAVDALYASMLGASAGHSQYNAAAAAAMGLTGLPPPAAPPGYSSGSSSSGLAGLAAAQQQAQAAALASLGPQAAWWNLAGLQQMEMLARLQGGMGGYPGLHPEQLMNLELLQAQQAAIAAALSAPRASAASRTSSNGSSSSSSSTNVKLGSRASSSSTSAHHVGRGGGSHHSSREARHRDLSLTSSRLAGIYGTSPVGRLDLDAVSRSSSHRNTHSGSSHKSSDSGISVRSDLGVGSSGPAASSSLSYGIASLMADKRPPSRKATSPRISSNPSDMLRNKELEIIPISPVVSHDSPHASKDEFTSRLFASSDRPPSYSSDTSKRYTLPPEAVAGGGGGSSSRSPFSLSGDSTPKVSISSLSNGFMPGLTSSGSSGWKEEAARVSIEPCPRPSSFEDTPLNLSLKSGQAKTDKKGERDKGFSLTQAEQLGRLKPPPSAVEYSQAMAALGMGLVPPEMGSGLEMLHSLYGGAHQGGGETRDVLASMQEALQRQLLAADTKKKEEKRRKAKSNLSAEDGHSHSEKVRHLGRGVSKPKKNTVASLLEHCRAAGIKPQLPLSAQANLPATASSSSGAASPPSSTQHHTPLPPSLIPLFASASSSSATPQPASSTSPSVSMTSFSLPLPPHPFGLPPPPSTSTSSSSPAAVSSLPLSLPPSLSISSITSPRESSPTPHRTASPNITVHPASSHHLSNGENKMDCDSSPNVSGFLRESLEKKQDFWASLGGIASLAAATSGEPSKKTTIEASHPNLPHPLASLFPHSIQEMSDSESGNESGSFSSQDEDDPSRPPFPSPWLKSDDASSDQRSSPRSTKSPPVKKRKMITDERSLRVPLMYGWRREITMRGITQSGVRGEVVYYAPCGKAFKQYPDIMRYLERQNIGEVTRDNFSFSSKITVGDFVDPNTQRCYSEQDIREVVREIRIKKGFRVQQSQSPSSQSKKSDLSTVVVDQRSASPSKEDEVDLEAEAEAILRRLESEERARKGKVEGCSRLDDPRSSKFLREQERVKKQEELRKEKEEHRKQREEVTRQRLYVQLRRTQEKEQEKQKQKLIKEQERERRRYHVVLVRMLEARKRLEEREKRREVVREEKRVFKERKREERLAARELSLLMKEVKEDMELTDHHRLPTVPRVEGLRVPPEAFQNVIMIFEFLHNFGETLGFDMESLPSLHSLQMALLGDAESEEELLNVLSHLMVCVIEDPGVPNSQRNTTILGQTLNRTDITHANISEILSVYLFASATGEVRAMYGLHGTEKERRETPSKSQEWDSRMEENEAFRMSQWLQKVPFVALSATQKSSVVCYVCDELLQNKAVLRQIEDSLDHHNGLKTEKWKIDSKIRKLRMNVARKRIYSTAMRSLTAVDATHREDSNMSAGSSNFWGGSMEGERALLGPPQTPDKKTAADEDEDAKHHRLKDADDDDDEDDDEEDHDSDVSDDVTDDVGASGGAAGHASHHDDEEEKSMSAEEASHALDSLQKEMDRVRQDLFETSQQVRGYNCGQDRYQRTMWVLPYAGGPFLEGINSCDYVGRSHFPPDVPSSSQKEGLTWAEIQALKQKTKDADQPNVTEASVEPCKLEVMDETSHSEVEGEEAINPPQSSSPTPHHGASTKVESKVEEKTEVEYSLNPDVADLTQTGEVSERDESVESSLPASSTPVKEQSSTPMDCGVLPTSEEILDPSLTPSKESSVSECSIDKDLLATGLGLIPGQYLRPEHVNQWEKLSFSIIPRSPCDRSLLAKLPHDEISSEERVGIRGEIGKGTLDSPIATPGQCVSNASTPLTSLTPVLQNSLASHAMSHQELLAKLHQTAEALPIPPEFKTGWWHFKDLALLREFTSSLNERGARESELRRFLERNTSIVENTLSKVDNEALSLEPISIDEDEEEGAGVVFDALGFPAPDHPQNWSEARALAVDLLALDVVYALEDKITNASMQTKDFVLTDVNRRSELEFAPACCPVEGKKNPIHFGRDLLLALEEGIERRYLKPPFGNLCMGKNENGVDSTSKNSATSGSGPYEVPRGLHVWRDAVSSCETAAQLAMTTSALESAVAWDKSIMKAFCQFCNGGNFEEKLLLCDGCDRGYHTHCFKPPMESIPDGDWFCFECLNKFDSTAERHCLVCGSVDSKTLVHCAACPRAYHIACITPPLAKMPRNKWNCPACSSKSPRTARRSRVKKPSEGSGSSTALPSKITTTPDDCQSPVPSSSSPLMRNGSSDIPSHEETASSEVVAPSRLSQSSHPHQPPSVPPTDSSHETPSSGESVEEPQHNQSNSHVLNSVVNGTSLPDMPATTPKKERVVVKMDKNEASTCRLIQKELTSHQDAWPFLLPVNTRQFPTYKKIIKKPIDLSTITKKLDELCYKSRDDYSDDIRLMFDNCETFNEDESPVGKAGHSLRSFFEASWNQHFAPGDSDKDCPSANLPSLY